jgi:mannose-6-phosphate isomerase-like protein (cupin superfamily)
MRVIVTGVDADGRSCIVEQGAPDRIALNGPLGPTRANLFAIDQSPPAPVARGQSRLRPAVLPPGHVNWYVIDHPPRDPAQTFAAPPEMHWRDSIDMLFIVTGGGELTLGDGTHGVSAGDCIVLSGSDHGFRPDAGGCQLMSFAIGTLPV